jgi:hypothetical protein
LRGSRRNRRLSKDYPVEGPNFGSLHRPGGHPPNAQTALPEVKLLKHPLRRRAADVSDLLPSEGKDCGQPFVHIRAAHVKAN